MFNAKDWGDLEVMGMYTGFFTDLSTGIIFGLRLPTGPYSTPGFDRDNQIGSGSTDLLLGAFHRGLLAGDNAWQYFSHVMWRQPFLYRDAAGACAPPSNKASVAALIKYLVTIIVPCRPSCLPLGQPGARTPVHDALS
jgi:hypothetical protein